MNKMAVLVIDMQRDFIDEGAPIECPGGREAIPYIQKLLAAARARGIPVIYTQEMHRKEKVDFGLELDGEEPEHCLEGTSGVEIVAALAPQKKDFIIVKRRYSGFFATDLDILLKGLGVDTLIIAGAATDVCVRATAQDAQQLGYKVIVPRECVAGTSREQHEAALRNISYILGKVMSLGDVLRWLQSESSDILTGVERRD
ncbi:MAG: cysteine hydrolase [Chloroflexi bacterium]|nr:cysteine hydrolase [Chloroflexota bacterium]